MNFDDLNLALNWREALIGVVVLLALYALIAVLRLRRLRQPEDPAPEAEALSPVPSIAPADPPVPAFEPAFPVIDPAFREPDFPWNEPPEPIGNDERISALNTELAQIRTEVAMLRGEIAAVREELKQQVERVQAVQHVAPIYGDAMQMALAGHDAAAIAERCGVARAEAELVVALVRNQDGSRADRIEPTMRDR